MLVYTLCMRVICLIHVVYTCLYIVYAFCIQIKHRFVRNQGERRGLLGADRDAESPRGATNTIPVYILHHVLALSGVQGGPRVY